MIDFRTDPQHYRHWRLSVVGQIATLTLDVAEDQPLVEGYELKLNSYDLGVDIELSDAIQRLRFEHPRVGAVVLTSAKSKVFCAGANIGMLAASSHAHKVNFCKFTNETRNAIEDAATHSGQKYLCAINGAAAGGGYELALACDYLLLVDDGTSSVSLPELPLLAVLPGTGGLTRLTDKRFVRPDHADFLCTSEEGVRGQRAVDWRLVDQVVAPTRFAEAVQEKAGRLVAASDRPSVADGIELQRLARHLSTDTVEYDHLTVSIDRTLGAANITLAGPDSEPPPTPDAMLAAGAAFWPLALCRELDDLILHLRANETEIGTLVFQSRGDLQRVAAFDSWLELHRDHWLVREIVLYWKRTLKRLELSSRSLLALIEPASCFAGSLLEIVLAADRSFMLLGQWQDQDSPLPPAAIRLSAMNFGPLPTINGLTRLQARTLGQPERLAVLRQHLESDLDAAEAERLGLVTFIPDDIDWQDEVRLAIEERASFSPDALTGMEASLRCAGPETMESKIFGRLTAWQNWIFQRPNAVGEQGALKRYGSGQRREFDRHRV